MAVKLTECQMSVVKDMVTFAEAFANQMYTIMKNHGLDKVDGFAFGLNVNPALDYSTMSVVVGRARDTDAGEVSLVRGKNDADYKPVGKNSAEYELLFADDAVRGAMEKVLHREKPLPPDGLWISNRPYDAPLGDWEWDVNDSLS